MFSRLPAVDRVVESAAAGELLELYTRERVVESVRREIDRLRDRLRAGENIDEGELSCQQICRRSAAWLFELSRVRLRTVVNATGVLLHTNLGRAELAESAAHAATEAALSPCALEYDLEEGTRGERDRLVEAHLEVLCGAEAATVVNNNAAAVLLVLNTLAREREVPVSRGELIEIGGSFRIPDIMAKSGARLREVGTTNRTHPYDYERAIGPQTAMLLKVHSSNYRIVGFTSSVTLEQLREIANRHDGLVVAEDLGAGALVDLRRWGLAEEPVVSERVAAGADIVTFSGDKLLGGPQCGLIAGRRELVERIRRNPLKRALRCDKMTLAALEETLRIYRFDPAPNERIPVLKALARPIDEVERAARRASELLREALGGDFCVDVEPSEARAGSGSQPEVSIASYAVAISSPSQSAEATAALFRSSDPPIIGRIEAGRFLLDLRAVPKPDLLVPGPS